MFSVLTLLSCSPTPADPGPEGLDADAIHALREWPAIPVPPVRPDPGRTPGVPELPNIESPTDDQLRARLQAIVHGMPSPAARADLVEAMESGALPVELRTRSGQVGAFAVAQLPTGERPFIGLDRVWLAGVDSAPEVLQTWILLAHEYLHYQQWLTADAAHRLTFAVFPDHPPPPLEPLGCAALWYDELAAYRLECEIAEAWGWPELGATAPCAGEDAAFRQRLYWIFRDGPAKEEENCAAIWAGLAGHPHPEAFNGYPFDASISGGSGAP